MEFVQNVPFFSIMISMFSGIVSSVLSGKNARRLNTVMIAAVSVMSLWLLAFFVQSDIGSYTFMMGHFPAPWGNEIRAGALEAGMALFVSIVMLLSMLGGRKKLFDEVELTKHNIYYILADLILSSLLALIYTNDMFTAYVFVEINTIAACGLIMIRQNGRTIEAAVRYMIMSLLGSGLLLLGICMLYDLTGHLLMSNMKEQAALIMQGETYRVPMLITIGIMTVGLAIKSALFPFHAWLPDAYGYSTVSSAAILSGLVSKGGSVSAIWENDIRRMIAFSSVAQIGYIYMGFGLGTKAGMIASIFHMLSHGATKALLFIAAIGLTDVSNGSRKFIDITGAGYRNKIAGVGFAIGSFSMVGMPIYSGFVSKFLFAEATINDMSWRMFPTLIVLAISTILNTIYFLKTVLRIYMPEKAEIEKQKEFYRITFREQKLYTATIIMFIVLNLILGMNSEPIIQLIRDGLHNFM